MDGSPMLAACWEDESINAELKSVAASSHAMVFHQRVLSTFAFVEGRRQRRRQLPDRIVNKKIVIYIMHARTTVRSHLGQANTVEHRIIRLKPVCAIAYFFNNGS